VSEMLRVREAVALARVSEDALRRLADAGRIGRARVGRTVLYCADDIRRLIAPQYAKPAATTVPAYPAPASEDWRDDPMWRGAL